MSCAVVRMGVATIFLRQLAILLKRLVVSIMKRAMEKLTNLKMCFFRFIV